MKLHICEPFQRFKKQWAETAMTNVGKKKNVIKRMKEADFLNGDRKVADRFDGQLRKMKRSLKCVESCPLCFSLYCMS